MRRGYAQTKPKRAPVSHYILQFSNYRLQVALLLFVALVAFGTFGYHIIEHWSYLDSFFMTEITLSTVGYGTVHDLDKAGTIFTSVLIVVGVGTATWALFTTFEVLVSEQRLRAIEKRRTRRLVNAMQNHFIVCGFGRIGRSIVEGYQRNNYPYVIIESDAVRAEELRAEGIPHIVGDAASDDVLKEAGIDRAKALITVTPLDAINMFIILSAKWLRPDLMIVARAISPDSVPKLKRAGASKVISPHVLGGWWMAATAINPAATDFIEGLRLAESSKSTLYEFIGDENIDNRTFGQMAFKQRSGALVVAIRQKGEFIANPPDTLIMHAGDALIAIGSVSELQKMAKVLNPAKPARIEVGLAGD